MIELSIIIPVFNEAAKIQKDILAADDYCTSKNLSAEIIVVDDGSTDDTSKVVTKTASQINTHCFLEQLEQNFGKGRAVKTGILKSTGKYVLFADSGNCIPFSNMEPGLKMITSGKCLIAHGSRKLSDCSIQKSQSAYRKFCSDIFKSLLVGSINKRASLTDSQCGFKLYDGTIARQLYQQSIIDGFMFDIEIILLALANGHTITEFPVNWTCDLDSRLKPIQQFPKIIYDLIKLKKRFK